MTNTLTFKNRAKLKVKFSQTSVGIHTHTHTHTGKNHNLVEDYVTIGISLNFKERENYIDLFFFLIWQINNFEIAEKSESSI